MCGIAGTLNLHRTHPIEEAALRRMLAMIRHRGPDQFGLYLNQHVALGSARLSIIDLSTGQQPIASEDGNLWIVFNGEIFNYPELRPDLEARGHHFSTQTDTEVLLHLFEEHGPDCLQKLNGQFAFAIWNQRERSLFLARDRLGIRPLFYTTADGALIFGSEIKAILADRRVQAQLDPATLEQVFTFWAPLSPRTIFQNIVEIPPGHYLWARCDKGIQVERYWHIQFEPAKSVSSRGSCDPLEDLGEFRSLLIDATRVRLRADVPVGAYLSGGLDSSTIAHIIRNCSVNRLDTFSIAFEDPQFDESAYQCQVARLLGTEHQVVHASYADIGEAFPDVIWHTETPVMRTAPAPMFLLSKRVRDCRFKVVMTGEGADEFLGGYDIFKEAKVRRFWARQPDSPWRPRLFRRLYPDISDLSHVSGDYLAAFFKGDLTRVQAPDFSHAVRWRNNRRTLRFFTEDVRQASAARAGMGAHGPEYPPGFMTWGPLERAQFLECTTFLSTYLLSSQGDRVAMAHSVEGRFPFLDYRVVEFCNRLPANVKLRRLTEKYLLKQLAREWLPKEIWQRVKRPYRAPIHRSFFHEKTPDYVRDLLSPGLLWRYGVFRPEAVAQLVAKIQRHLPVSETDDMALVGIISTQLLCHRFLDGFPKTEPLFQLEDVKVCRGNGAMVRAPG